MCKEELSEDFDHLIRCTTLQESWEEIEEATAQSIVKLQDEKEDNAEALREIKEILIPKEKEQRFKLSSLFLEIAIGVLAIAVFVYLARPAI